MIPVGSRSSLDPAPPRARDLPEGWVLGGELRRDALGTWSSATAPDGQRLQIRHLVPAPDAQRRLVAKLQKTPPSHPTLVAPHDVFDLGDRGLLIAEPADPDWSPLAAALEDGPLPDLLVLTIVVQVLHGLRATEAAGWLPLGPTLHRILFAGPSPGALRADPLRDPTIRIVDLGIETVRVPPAERSAVRVASDLRALGALASTLLDRKAPHSAGTTALLRRLTWSRDGAPPLDEALDIARAAAMAEWERSWFDEKARD